MFDGLLDEHFRRMPVAGTGQSWRGCNPKAKKKRTTRAGKPTGVMRNSQVVSHTSEDYPKKVIRARESRQWRAEAEEAARDWQKLV